MIDDPFCIYDIFFKANIELFWQKYLGWFDYWILFFK